ncbi:MAG: MBL fold metallo-hydrolase [Candidatus Schekmanbacteria bacterium]|nr:MBL fold metallo-hydrolase [Candidatus Schekmanbacteria bacterium]
MKKIKSIIGGAVHVLGTPFIPVYLIKGKDYAIIEGGLSMMWHIVKRQLSNLNVETQDISHLLFAHSHLDHVGMARLMKKENPNLHIAGTKEIAQALAAEVYNDSMKRMDENFEKILNLKFPPDHEASRSEKINVDVILEEDKPLDLGNGIKIEVIKTPGHSPCSTCVYIRDKQTMFISDSAGLILSGTQMMPMIFYSYKKLISSLENLSKYDVDTICLGHFAVIEGADAKDFFRKAKSDAAAFRDFVLKAYENKKEIGEVVKLLEPEYKKGNVASLPDIFFEGSAQTMVIILLREEGMI